MSESNKPEHAILNEYAQKMSTDKKLPEYNFTDRIINGKREFTAICKFQGRSTAGSAFSKSEAKRISAGNMLILLGVRDSTSPKKVQKESVIQSNKLEAFNSGDLDVHLDKYLETREKDVNKFRKSFFGNLPTDNSVDKIELQDDVKSPKSATLRKLNKNEIETLNSTNASFLFKTIMQEMSLTYFAEFLETADNDRYAVVIKLNVHLFTTCGVGETPQKAIEDVCKNAIEFLSIFNL